MLRQEQSDRPEKPSFTVLDEALIKQVCVVKIIIALMRNKEQTNKTVHLRSSNWS